MKPVTILVGAVLALSSLASAQTTSPADRDKTVAAIDACLQRNELSSRECRKLNENVAKLVQIYKSGDKSVLPLLFKFTYLTDFYDDALLADPVGFLAVMKELPMPERAGVAQGVSGGLFRALQKPTFDKVRSLLNSMAADPELRSVAHECLETLENNNASLFLQYFPSGTFNNQAADFQIHWYSRDMHSLGELPLIPVADAKQVTYRFTYLGAFTGPEGFRLDILEDGTGRLDFTARKQPLEKLAPKTKALSREEVVTFLEKLDQSKFWQMPSEGKGRGFDGAEWIMEGVREGQYHIAVRWCPGSYPKHEAPEDRIFADAARILLQLSGLDPKHY